MSTTEGVIIVLYQCKLDDFSYRYGKVTRSQYQRAGECIAQCADKNLELYSLLIETQRKSNIRKTLHTGNKRES